MAWNDAPPKPEELKAATPAWDATPPTPQELKSATPSYLDKNIMGVTPRGLIQGSLNTLPAAGMVAGGFAGGAAGTAAMPVVGTAGGAVVGAGIGGGIGESLKNLGEHYILGQEKTRGEIYGNPAKGFIEGAGTQGAGEIAGQAASAIAKTPAAKAIGSKAGGFLAKAGTKVGELFTGVPEQEIATYAKKADEIKAMAKASDNSTAEAADTIRQGFTKDIQKTRQALNSQIGATLEQSDKTVSAKPILDSLEAQKSKINMRLNPEDGKQIDALMTKIKSVVNPDGTMAIKDAHDVKTTLQDIAFPAYGNPGQIFQYGKPSQQAAKAGAASARDLINQAEPAVKSANDQLYRLHQIEDKMNPNLIAPGKPEAGLISAGTGGNARNAKNLDELGQLTGSDMKGEAEKLAAMRTFGSPKLTPADTTGKAAGRMGLGAGLGYLVGHAPGAFIGGAMTSPAALKAAIDSGQITAKEASYLMNSSAGRGLIGRGLLNQSEPSAADQAQPPLSPGLIYQAQQKKKDENRKPNSN